MSAEFEFEWASFEKVRKNFVQATTLSKPKIQNDFICVCGGVKTINQDGFPTCEKCGISNEHWIDDGAEWVNNSNDDGHSVDKSRCGAVKDTELFSEQWGNSTVMKSSGRQTASSRRIARINFHQSMNHRDRALYHAYKSMDEAAKNNLSLSDKTIRTAKIMYRKFNQDKLTRGAVRTGIKANCILYACKIEGIPRTTREIADAFGIPTKDISRTTEIFRTTLLDETQKSDDQSSEGISKPVNVVSRLLNEFAIENRRAVAVKCKKLATILENCVELMGKTPNSIAAVIIFKVFDGQVTKHDVVKKCGVSMPTLNKIESTINKYLEGLKE